MRKLSSLAGAALMAATVFAIPAPAHAQAMSAGGSCGPSFGNYGYTDINSNMVNASGETVPMVFVEINYAGVPAPTTLYAIVRYNDELETQAATINLGTASSSGGTVRRQIFSGANPIIEGGAAVGFTGPDPETQGFANSIDAGRRGRSDGPPSGGNAEHGNGSGYRIAKGGLQNSGTQGGLLPGDYVFYIYTGEARVVPNVKDGGNLSNFVVDQMVGKFSCGVSTSQGSGPG